MWTLALSGSTLEFADGFLATNPPQLLPFDKDFNGSPDLAAGWSTPNIGRILVLRRRQLRSASPTNDLEDRYVAIIGGGLDRTNESGDWLYMIDIETGESIYKQRLLDGAVSGAPLPRSRRRSTPTATATSIGSTSAPSAG